MVTLAQRIESLRTEKGLSRSALAAALGFPKGSVDKFETGRQTPTKEQQDKMAAFFGVSLFYLRGGYAPDRVRGLDRVLMAGMKRHLAGKSDPQSQAALAAMRQGADWVSADQLGPVLAWLGS